MKLAVVLLGLLAVFLLAVWAQRRGWVNFRAAGSGLTAGMAEAGRVLEPPTTHVQTVREETPARSDEDDRPAEPDGGGRCGGRRPG